jgi:hypothetical protein
MASIPFTPAFSICCLKSGPESTTSVASLVSIKIDERKRLSCLSVDWQTGHWQATTGTPCDVPVPKNVIFKTIYFKLLIIEL